MPKFSILITTRNRPDLFINALLSVLHQDFQDLEVVVSDNSDSEESAETYATLEPYLIDARVRYIRPERLLNMTDHWEWALAQLTGEYVGILTDRMVYRLQTLSIVNDYISKHDPKVIAFGTADVSQGIDGFGVPHTESLVQVVINKTQPFIDAFSKSDFSRMDMPRLLNSFVKSNFVDYLRKEYGSVFAAIAPDYSFFMRIADQLEEFPFIKNALLLKHSEGRSNGKSFTWLNPTKTSHDFIELSKRDQARYIALSPIPSELVLVSNMMSREYECGRHFAKRKLFPPYDRQKFYDASMKYVKNYAQAGKDVTRFNDILANFKQENELSDPPAEIQQKLKSIFRRIRRRLTSGKMPSVAQSARHFPTILDALQEDYHGYRGQRTDLQ